MSKIEFSIEGRVAKITLASAGGNRIDFEMRRQILDLVESVRKSDARVLMIAGAGTDFCLGGDIREWPDMPLDRLRPAIEVFAHAIDAIERLSIPTVALVQGQCAGGGFELALGCDFIVAGRSARFIFPEATLGIMTLQGGAYRLAERIGRTKALELTMLPRPIEAVELARWNVVNQVHADETLAAAALAFAERLSTVPPQLYASTKELLRIWQQHGVGMAGAGLYELSMPLLDDPSVRQALSAAADRVNAGLPITEPPP